MPAEVTNPNLLAFSRSRARSSAPGSTSCGREAEQLLRIVDQGQLAGTIVRQPSQHAVEQGAVIGIGCGGLHLVVRPVGAPDDTLGGIAGDLTGDCRDVFVKRTAGARGFVAGGEFEPVAAAIDQSLNGIDLRPLGRHAGEELAVVIENPAAANRSETGLVLEDIGAVEL